MNHQTSIDEEEVAKFAQWGEQWWDPQGPFKTLHAINPLRLKLIQSTIDVSGQRVLDLGCGGGILCEGLAKAGAQVTGLDVEPHAIETAQQHAKASHLAIQYEAMPMEIYEAPAYPVVTCMEMLEHVTDPSQVIFHAQRLLAPGGYLFLSTINRTMQAYMSMILGAEYLLNLLPRQTHDYKKFIKPSELAQIARHHDLTVLDIQGMRYSPCRGEGELHASVAVNYFMICQKLLTE